MYVKVENNHGLCQGLSYSAERREHGFDGNMVFFRFHAAQGTIELKFDSESAMAFAVALTATCQALHCARRKRRPRDPAYTIQGARISHEEALDGLGDRDTWDAFTKRLQAEFTRKPLPRRRKRKSA